MGDRSFIATRIKLIVLDVDGVLKDGSLFISEKGELIKQFNAKDGMAISIAIRTGLQVAIITGKNSSIVLKRATDLGIREVFLGVKNKTLALEKLLTKLDIKIDDTCFVGDDLNDLAVFTKVWLACAPQDAPPEFLSVCHSISDTNVVLRAVRVIYEYNLKSVTKWADILSVSVSGSHGDQTTFG